MPPKRASKKTQPSKPSKPKPNPKSTSSATRKSTLRQPQPRAAIPTDPEILASFRAYAISRDAISNPSDLSDEEEDDNDGAATQLLRVRDVRRCMRALDLPAPPADFFDDDQRYVRSEEFVELARTLAETVGDGSSDADEGDDGAYEDDDDEDEDEEDPEQAREIDEAFALFLSGRPGGGGDGGTGERRITVADLRRVARSLKEDVDDKTLAMMVEEANGETGRASVGRGVGRREFEEVMRRARVFT